MYSLEDMMGRNLVKNCVAGASAAAAATPVHVITISRANNVAIMLTQFADWDGEAIRAAAHGASKLSPEKISLLLQVRHLQSCHLMMQHYESLLLGHAIRASSALQAVAFMRRKGTDGLPTLNPQIAPTDEEISAMRAFDGTYEDLAPPERVLALLASVPRLRQKLQVLLFQRQFGGLVADASVALRFAQAACTQVSRDHVLKRDQVSKPQRVISGSCYPAPAVRANFGRLGSHSQVCRDSVRCEGTRTSVLTCRFGGAPGCGRCCGPSWQLAMPSTRAPPTPAPWASASQRCRSSPTSRWFVPLKCPPVTHID